MSAPFSALELLHRRRTIGWRWDGPQFAAAFAALEREIAARGVVPIVGAVRTIQTGTGRELAVVDGGKRERKIIRMKPNRGPGSDGPRAA